MRYSAFISYNHRDRGWARWLHGALERYRLPKRLRGRAGPDGPIGDRLKPVFRDRDELAASGDLGESVRRALDEAANLIVILSPDAARSHWVDEEVRYFIDLGRRDRIRCLIVEGVPNAADAALECLPPALRSRPGEEPLAADPRPDGDGKRGAALKLIAGLLDLPYDELRQREAARRQRRLALAAAASLAGLVVTSGLAIVAFVQRDLARERTLTAERTVDFVKSMFAVADPSEARGETTTVREVLDRGAVRLRQELANEPAVRAELTLTLTEVYASLGLYRRADAMLREAGTIRHGQPAITARQYTAAGESLARAGEYKAAIRAFELALKEPALGDSARSLALVGLGQALSNEGEDARAKAVLERALALDRANPAATPRDIARDLEALGLVEYYAGRHAAAVPLVESALRLNMRSGGAMAPSVADNLNLLASIAYEGGDPARAESYLRRNLAVDEKVLGAWHPDLATSLNNLARIMIERRDYAGAMPLLERALAIVAREKSQTHDDLAFMLMNLGITQRAMGKAEAEPTLRRALAIAERHGHRTRGLILGELADLRCAAGRADGSAALIGRAKVALAADYDAGDWRAAWIADVQAGCIAAEGRRVDARGLFARSGPALLARWNPASHFGAEAAARRRRAA